MDSRPALSLPSRLALAAYRVVADVLLPPAILLASPVLRLNPKRRETLFPRLGFQEYPAGQPAASRPVWVHALSVGELLSALPFLQTLKAGMASRRLVVSVSTLAARQLAATRLGGIADALIYFPFDTALAYRRCLARIQPAAFILIETDVWPGYLRHFRKHGVPCWLLNGRLSPQSLRGLRRARWLAGPALACFERIHGQSAAENARYASLGVPAEKLGEPGNLKFDACGIPLDEAAIAQLRRELGYAAGDRIVIGGSTHPGEEELLREAWRRARDHRGAMRLISVPRHPARAGEVRALFRNSGLDVQLLSERETGTDQGQGGGVQPAREVLVVDRLGYLNHLYSICDVAVVGGSFVPKGGQNPIEPAAAGKPVLFGPDMSDFPEISQWLVEAGAARSVRDGVELEQRLRALLDDPAEARAVGERGRALVTAHRGATARIAASILARLAAAD